MDTDKRKELFHHLQALLDPFAGDLTAEIGEGRYSLSTTKPIIVDDKVREEGYYFAGLREQKNIVGFYFMPLHVCPELIAKVPASLQKLLKGKTCFNVKAITPQMSTDFRLLMEMGIATYRANGWM
jgi:hypothetical protein